MNHMGLLILLLVFILVAALFAYMIAMPGKSWQGDLPSPDGAVREIRDRLVSHIDSLCAPEERNYLDLSGLAAARLYIEEQLQEAGYRVELQKYDIGDNTFANVIVELEGDDRAAEILVVGAHYDAVIGTTGADDNASGVAALLELARSLRGQRFPRSVRFAFFVNEEPPFFMTEAMGSHVSASRSRENNENIIGMISLEMLGYYSDRPGSQHYFPPLNFFYPDKGNFIAFVSNLGSRSLLTRSLRLFRKEATFPSEGIAAPAIIPGINWSDHNSYWKHGYPAIMVTDTALYRNPFYHTPQDRPETLDYERMAYVVRGLENVIKGLLLQ